MHRSTSRSSSASRQKIHSAASGCANRVLINGQACATQAAINPFWSSEINPETKDGPIQRLFYFQISLGDGAGDVKVQKTIAHGNAKVPCELPLGSGCNPNVHIRADTETTTIRVC
jgi:hypothetical protein